MACLNCNNEKHYAKGLCKRCYQNALYHSNPKRFNERNKIYYQKYKDERLKKQTCDIIKKHHEDMKDDPEKLTTEFLLKIVRVDCEN